jgi:hypothetical protein
MLKTRFDVTCNTAEDVRQSNIISNIKNKDIRVLKLKRAVIVGGGYSASHYIDEIKARQDAGYDVFALNGAYNWLQERGVIADYAIFYDSRPENVVFASNPHSSTEFLIASQCHPCMFTALEDYLVTMFHMAGETSTQKLIFEHVKDAHVLGGTLTVGLQALNIAYTMGYRDVKLYGYDSSAHETQKHAYAQPLNDGQILHDVPFNGNIYKCAAPMAAQAKAFMDSYKVYVNAGIAIEVIGDGLLPAMWKEVERVQNNLAEKEALKYRRMWEFDSYRKFAPGESKVEHAIAELEAPKGASFIDFGTGTGRAAKKLQMMGYKVLAVDFAVNCLDEDVFVPFCLANLWELPDLKANFGYCTDVMEHIPPEKVDDVLKGITSCVNSAYFMISTRPDSMGELISEVLHETVQPPQWWAEKLRTLWNDVFVTANTDSVILVCKNKKD